MTFGERLVAAFQLVLLEEEWATLGWIFWLDNVFIPVYSR